MKGKRLESLAFRMSFNGEIQVQMRRSWTSCWFSYEGSHLVSWNKSKCIGVTQSSLA